MTFGAVAIGIILILKLFPETPAARLLHTWLVERPAAWMAGGVRQQLLFALLVLAMMFAGAEAVLLMGSVDAAMVFAWDMSLVVDALIAAWAAASLSRITTLMSWLALRRPGTVRRVRSRAIRRRRRRLRAQNDDEAEPARHCA